MSYSEQEYESFMKIVAPDFSSEHRTSRRLPFLELHLQFDLSPFFRDSRANYALHAQPHDLRMTDDMLLRQKWMHSRFQPTANFSVSISSK